MRWHARFQQGMTGARTGGPAVGVAPARNRCAWVERMGDRIAAHKHDRLELLPIGKGLMNKCLICRGRDVYQRPVEGLITGGLQALNPCLTV